MELETQLKALGEPMRLPLANLVGHGDVGAYSLDQVREFCRRSGLHVEKLERGRKFRLHLVARKRKTDVKARSAECLEHVSGKGERMNTHKLGGCFFMWQNRAFEVILI